MKIGRGYVLALILLDEGQTYLLGGLVWFLSTDNVSSGHHEYDVALKSPRIIVKWGLRFCTF